MGACALVLHQQKRVGQREEGGVTHRVRTVHMAAARLSCKATMVPNRPILALLYLVSLQEAGGEVEANFEGNFCRVKDIVYKNH